MGNIIVGRYANPDLHEHWQGWIEPEDKSWIAFVDAKGQPTFFLNRDLKTGAVL